MTQHTGELLVLITCKGTITAKKIAREVVAQDFASNARIISGVNSFFRWVGKLENTDEQLLLIRTRRADYENVEKCIRQLHPHELPEITVVPVYSNPANLEPG